jgi:S-formylglutathione hydrolase FrmB
MRRIILGSLGVLALFAVLAGSAQATTVQQWNTPSPYVPQRDLFKADLVNGHLVTNVVLPTGYKSRSCWPVMYLLHGTAATEQTIASLQWLQLGVAKMNIPAVLVIPGAGNDWWINNWWNGARRPGFEDWVLKTIVPLVAKRLHICSARSDHAIAGLSMGGYGAMYLASELPSYFGTAASFSGVLSPESEDFVEAYLPYYNALWGPPGRFYAVGHDTLALVKNLAHTRLFVSAGNGVALPGEPTSAVAVWEETEFDKESKAFAAVARHDGIPVKFDQFVGTHSGEGFLKGLNGFLAWKPFAPVVSKPRSWTFSTVETAGNAWGYQFVFEYHPPQEVEQFTLSNGVFEARGSGLLHLVMPNGKTVVGQIPFKIRNGKVVELHGVKPVHLVGGFSGFYQVTASISPSTVSPTQPITIKFKTQQKLPRGYEYQLGAGTFSSGCVDAAAVRVSPPAAGTVLRAVIDPAKDSTAFPGSTAKPPGVWCKGTAVAAVTVVKGAQAQVGTIIGEKGFTVN